ncbi:MAG TPA: hypothetical protein VEC17_02675 [Candidatus Binatia bacterium]|nr:hypothetical protein [Candidatus Binatia bacterium]
MQKPEAIWKLSAAQAEQIARTPGELRKLPRECRLINNAMLVRKGSRYEVHGTRQQVSDTKRRVKLGQVGMLLYQNPKMEHAQIGDPRFNPVNQQVTIYHTPPDPHHKYTSFR